MRNLTDCDTCMQTTDLATRQYLRCGYEPPAAPGVVTQAFMPKGFKPHARRPGELDEPVTCPGYTTKLPEVVGVSRARMHYKNNALAIYLGGEPATDQLLTAIEILESAVNECESLRMTPAKDGGLRE